MFIDKYLFQEIELEWNITVYNAKLPVNHNKNRYVNIIPCECVHVRACVTISDLLLLYQMIILELFWVFKIMHLDQTTLMHRL